MPRGSSVLSPTERAPVPMKNHVGGRRSLALTASLLFAYQTVQAGVEAEALRCEYRNNPQGIDEILPRLSWRLDADGARGVRQTAYHILVASSAALLKKGTGDLWDSGKTSSDASIQIAYAGRPLASRQACFWKVRVYDQDGKASPWSEPATWTMGLLQPGDWQARWIGKDEAAQDNRLAGCAWIGYPEGTKDTTAAPGLRYYRRTFEWPAGRVPRKAELVLAGDNSFECWVNGEQALNGHEENREGHGLLQRPRPFRALPQRREDQRRRAVAGAHALYEARVLCDVRRDPPAQARQQRAGRLAGQRPGSMKPRGAPYSSSTRPQARCPHRWPSRSA